MARLTDQTTSAYGRQTVARFLNDLKRVFAIPLLQFLITYRLTYADTDDQVMQTPGSIHSTDAPDIEPPTHILSLKLDTWLIITASFTVHCSQLFETLNATSNDL